MGRHTRSGVVAAKLEQRFDQQQEIVKAKLASLDQIEAENLTPFVLNGWTYHVDLDPVYPVDGKNHFYPSAFVKGDLRVYEINEDEYSDGQSIEEKHMSYYAEDEATLMTFCNDFGWTEGITIRTPAAIQQTL